MWWFEEGSDGPPRPRVRLGGNGGVAAGGVRPDDRDASTASVVVEEGEEGLTLVACDERFIGGASSIEDVGEHVGWKSETGKGAIAGSATGGEDR